MVDAFSRWIVDWSISGPFRTELILDDPVGPSGPTRVRFIETVHTFERDSPPNIRLQPVVEVAPGVDQPSRHRLVRRMRRSGDQAIRRAIEPEVRQHLASEDVDELGLVAPDVVDVDLVEAHVHVVLDLASMPL